MKGLVVVHAELGYVNEIKSFDFEIFDNISEEIEKYSQEKNKIYFLADECRSVNSKLMPVGIKKFASDLIFIPNILTEAQFMITKEMIIKDNLDEMVVAGVVYECCVKDLNNLFLGNGRMDEYKQAFEYLNWKRERLEFVFNKKLNSRIENRLTDFDGE